MVAVISIPTAEAKDLLDPIIVTATKIKTKDTKATYASEVYSREEIERSGAKSLYDFLNQNTSTAIMPSYGNPFNQLIDIRGYGLTDGFKNVVISVNGRRLNNIDSVPQQLSTIPLDSIDRIEITKGSGSVVYGDGATAGSIQIYTRDTTETSITGSGGNYGIKTGSFTTGLSQGKFLLSASGALYEKGGFSDPGPDGHKDSGNQENYQIKLRFFPTESNEVFIEKDSTAIYNRYPNALDKGTFEVHPGSNSKTKISSTSGPQNYTRENQDIDNLTLGGTIELRSNLEAALTYTHQDKVVVNSTHKQYHNNAFDSNIKYLNGPFKIITGVQTWEGKRRNTNGTASKDNIGLFVQGDYDIGSTVLSLGVRREWVDYTHQALADEDDFWSYDLGINKSFSDHLSIFSNFNHAFLAPDIDRFFGWNSGFTAIVFNGFIDPTISNTLNIGLNHTTPTNKAKLTIYGVKLKQEQFYNPVTYVNTNIDKSHKYGLELQNNHVFNNALSVSVNYAYVRAIIDHEDTNLNCSNNCDENELPWVSDHNITLGINYTPTSKSRVVLGHVYRSEAFSGEDFCNCLNQKQKAYNFTNLSYTYTHKTDNGKGLFNWWASGPRQVEFSAKVENPFELYNGSWLKDDAIYPYHFTRNWSLGAKFKF